MKVNWLEFLVGCFMIAGITAAVILALKVAGLTLSTGSAEYYTVYGNFSNIGSLKVRSPVKLGGVVIGSVSDIRIDPKTLQPVVAIQIDRRYSDLGADSTFSVLTSGLLGEQYLGVKPDFASMDDDGNPTYLKDGDRTNFTESAIVLEELLGKFLYSISSDKSDENTGSN